MSNLDDLVNVYFWYKTCKVPYEMLVFVYLIGDQLLYEQSGKLENRELQNVLIKFFTLLNRLLGENDFYVILYSH